MVSEVQLQEYIELYKTEFGEDLSTEIALDSVLELLNLVRTIYKPMKP